MNGVTQLRFLHLPKTAGSSFVESLFLSYPAAYWLRRRFVFSGRLDADRQRYEKLSRARRDRLELFLGHAPRVTGIDEVDVVPTITLLRDPVERVKSFCQHVSDGKSPFIFDRGDAGAFDLDAFLSSGRTQLSNFQSKVLLGTPAYALPQGSDADLAARACRVLEEKLYAFGITEEFDHSMLLFRRALGWDRAPHYRLRNVGGSGAVLRFEQRHLDHIVALNRVDIELYRLALQAFHSRLAGMRSTLAAELDAYRRQLGDSPPAVFGVMDRLRCARRLIIRA